MTKLIIALTTLFILGSCKREEVTEGKTTPDNKALIASLNAKSHDTLIIGSGRFILEAYLWRDFMPISPENGKPLMSINWLRNLNSAHIPAHIDMVKQFVIYKDSLWIPDYVPGSRTNQPGNTIEKYSTGGPNWGPNVYVDVISQVRDSLSMKDYYIRVKRVYVERTE